MRYEHHTNGGLTVSLIFNSIHYQCQYSGISICDIETVVQFLVCIGV